MKPQDDPVLKRFRVELDKIYGDRLERVVLFGSRARGDAREDSDYDVAVFMRNLASPWHEMDRIAAVEADILFETGQHIQAFAFQEKAYDQRTLFMHEVRNDGIDL